MKDCSQTDKDGQQQTFLSATATVIIFSIVLFVLSLDHTGPKPSTFGIHRYLLEWVQAGHDLNLQGQRDAHVFGLLACAVCILFSAAVANARLKLKLPSFAYRLPAFFIVCFSVASSTYWLAQPVSKPAWYALAAAFLLVVFKTKNLLHRVSVNKLLLAILILLGLLSVVPGLLAPYDASWMSANSMVEFQEGYSVVTAQGDQIAQGQRIFEQIKPHYGILLPVLCGLYERSFGLLSFGQNIQMVRFLQFVNVVAIFLVYYWYSRKKALPLAIAFLMVLPWLHANQISILFPNLSSWRNLSFAVAALGLMLLQRLPNTMRASMLGALSGLCLALNQEIGVAISLGILAYVYYSTKHPGSIFTRAFIFDAARLAMGIIIFIACLYAFLSLSLGYLPNLQAYFDYLKYAQSVARSGYSGGFRIEYTPLALLIFCHYCYVLISAAMSTKRLTTRVCFRTFAATTGLIWFAYYFNRPHEWYLQPQFFLYGFLVIDLVRAAQSRAQSSIANKVVATVVIIMCIIPQEVLAVEKAWPQYRKMIRVARGKTTKTDAQLVDGLFIDANFARELSEKSAFVAKESQQRKLVYLTGSTMLIPRLSGYYPAVDVADPFQQLLTEKLTNDFVTSVKKSQTVEVLIDSKNCQLSGDKSRQDCWEKLEHKLNPEFTFEKCQSGWRILKRRLKHEIDNKVAVPGHNI